MKPLFTSPSLAGLDIQPNGIRLVQMSQTRKKLLIERVITMDLPNPIFVEGKIKDWDLLGSALTKLVVKNKMENMATAISLSANLVRMQHLQIPSGMTEHAIEAEIRTQVTRDFPGMTETLCMDFIESTHTQTGYSDIFFVVARKDYVTQYINCIHSTGLKVKIVDIDLFALKRLMHLVLPRLTISNHAYALVYTVQHTVSFCIFNMHNIIFHQQWNLIDTMDFQTQLKNRMQIFSAMFGMITISQWAICAAKEQLTWITPIIQNIFDGNICYPDPFSQMKCKTTVDFSFLSANATEFLIACGLAMREVLKW